MTLRYRDLPKIPGKQLRPGNIVTDGSTNLIINAVGEKQCRCTFLHPHKNIVSTPAIANLRPVVVNQQRIEDMGFYPISQYSYRHTEIDVHLQYNGSDFFELFTHDKQNKIAEGNFVHHLQNLITDLSIKEYRP